MAWGLELQRMLDSNVIGLKYNLVKFAEYYCFESFDDELMLYLYNLLMFSELVL